MKDESKIVELLAESLLRADRHEELLGQLIKRADNHDILLEKLVNGQNKTNLALNELGLSNVRIVEVLENNLKLEGRVKKLENKVFKRAS